MKKKAPFPLGRQVLGAQPAEEGAAGPLSRAPAAMAQAVDRMSSIRSQVGGPDLARLPPGGLVLSYDDRAREMGVRTARVLDMEEDVARAAGTTPEKLDRRTAQCGQAHRFKLTAREVVSDVSDTKAVVTWEEQRAQRALVREIERAIARLPPGSDERLALESDAADVLAWHRKRQQKDLDKAAQTREERQAHAQTLDTANRRKVLAQAIADLADGLPVDPAIEEEVLAAQDAPPRE